MVDQPHSLRSGNIHPSPRSQCIPFYGCQSLWMGCSSRADEAILSWSLDRRLIPAPYQYSRNNGHSVFQMFRFPSVDLFATHFNHKLSLYVSPVPYNQAFVIDALSMNWNNLHAYAFPPTVPIPSFLAKICQSHCGRVLIAPLWLQRSWFSEALQLLVSAQIRLP